MANNRDNAQQKFVRSLANLNAELVKPGSGDEITVNLKANGGGTVLLDKSEGCCHGPINIYTAHSAEALNEFLDADPLARLVLVATQAA